MTDTTLSRIEHARATGQWDPLVQSVPYARFLGLSVAVKDGKLTGTMKYADHLIGNPTLPALHGGTLGAILETMAQFELLYRAEAVLLPKTITLTIDYRRSGRPVDTFVSATIVRQGRRGWPAGAPPREVGPARPHAAPPIKKKLKLRAR